MSDNTKIPKPIGPYSVAQSFEKLIFTSGQIGMEPETGILPETVEEQTDTALKNLSAVLESMGGSLETVIKTTVFLDSMEDFSKMNGVYQNYFKSDYPARSAVEVGKLPKKALVEIEAIAVKKS